MYRTQTSISVEMKLVIVLLSVTFALCYEEQYRGFNDCGVDGWSCDGHGRAKYEITYRCPTNRPDARVWIWTARFPNGVSIFTVKDCNHLEVHFDCTTGLRNTLLKQFNVINVTTLDILPPLLPGVFLHDNDQVPQAPPTLNIVNVTKFKLYPGVFDKPTGGCRYKFLELASLSLENVHIDRMMKDMFHNQNMDEFVMKNAVIDAIDSNAMTIAADTSITGCTFPFIPANGMSFRGESISFVNNSFKKIETLGLTIKSRKFKFSNNNVEEINTQGLEVLGAKIEITKNTLNHLGTGAFERVTPGYSFLNYEIASKFIYNFSENIVKNLNPGSLHPNWEIYKKVCYSIIFENNLFECSCTNLGWMSVSNGLGPKITKVKEFYDVYFNKEYNKCFGHKHCPLNAVLSQIQDVCKNKTNVSTICASLDSVTDVDTTTSQVDVTIPFSNSIHETKEEQSQNNITGNVEKDIPVLSYTENQTSEQETRAFPVWFIVIPVTVIVTTICVATFMWWYKKKKQTRTVTSMYKNHRGGDADNLIVVNELHNELYNKQ